MSTGQSSLTKFIMVAVIAINFGEVDREGSLEFEGVVKKQWVMSTNLVGLGSQGGTQ